MEQFDVLILGGGASGLAAAIEAARQDKRLRVGVIERLDRVGKKILATGNGRCNLSNLHASPDDYNAPEFVEKVFRKKSPPDNMEFFRSLGLLTVADSEGRVYPYSGTATSVLDVLRFEAQRLGVEIVCSQKAETVTKNKNYFTVNGRYSSSALILSCGGKSSPSQGSDGSGYELLRQLGLTVTELKPSLVQLKTQQDFVKSLKGLRSNARITLERNGRNIAESKGEILFTDYGLSGIAAMEISRDAEKDCTLKIDFLPDYSEKEVFDMLYLNAKRNRDNSAEFLLTGILHSRIAQAILKGAITDPGIKCSRIKSDLMQKIAKDLKCKKIKVTGKNGFDQSQVTAGGAELSQFEGTLESKKCPGLFVTGELLDVDGRCGGFNLAFAWSSGRLAGEAAAQKLLKRARV